MKTLTIFPAAGLLLASFCCTMAAAAPPADDDIGYKTVAEALEAVPKKPGAQVTQPGGWTIVAIREPEFEIWSFTPPGHYAHPAAVRRTVVEEHGQIGIRMTALCQAAKAPCDRLIGEFLQMNEQMRAEIDSRRKRGKE